MAGLRECYFEDVAVVVIGVVVSVEVDVVVVVVAVDGVGVTMRLSFPYFGRWVHDLEVKSF